MTGQVGFLRWRRQIHLGLIVIVGEMAQLHPSLSRAFATEFLQRMQEKTPPVKLAVSWIEERLAEDGLTVAQLVQSESQHQAATPGFSRQLHRQPAFSRHNGLAGIRGRTKRGGTNPARRPGQNLFEDGFCHARSLSAHRGTHRPSQQKIPSLKSQRLPLNWRKKMSDHPDDRLAHVGFFLTGKGVKILERAAGMKIPIRSILPRIARRFPLAFYLGGIVGVAFLATIPLLRSGRGMGISGWAFGLLAFLSAALHQSIGRVAGQLVCDHFRAAVPLAATGFFRRRSTCARDLGGRPDDADQVAPGIDNLLEALEVRYLANHDQNSLFRAADRFSRCAGRTSARAMTNCCNKQPKVSRL